MSQLFDPNWQRASILPVGRNKQTGQLAPATPQVMVDLLSALMLPGDVYKGNVLLNDPETGHTNMDVIRRSADLAGAVTLGAGAIPAEANTLRAGIRAYHGTPHDFDKFEWSPKTRGTGEGAQAYGDGLYFAENEAVAKQYRDDLTKARTGRAWNKLRKHGDDVDAAIADTQAEIARLRSLDLTPETGSERRDSLISMQEETLAELAAFKRNDNMNRGHMYEVNINANPEDFLDWDAPVERQPQKVRELLEPLARRAVDQGGMTGMPTTGEELLSGAKSVDWPKYADDQGAIERQLREAGIPGIRFRDAGSRGKDGDGTRNYVVFDDKLISIVRKYGIAAAIAAGVITQQQAAQMQAQGDI
jgi:hypothetical protein